MLQNAGGLLTLHNCAQEFAHLKQGCSTAPCRLTVMIAPCLI